MIVYKPPSESQCRQLKKKVLSVAIKSRSVSLLQREKVPRNEADEVLL